MTIANWVSVVVGIVAIMTAFVGSIRWMVKHYLYELKPNGGSSLKDSVKRLEDRVDDLFKLIVEKL